MYSLEIININKTADVFFSDVNNIDSENIKQFEQEVRDKNQHNFYQKGKLKRTFSRRINKSGYYEQRVTTGYFKTIDAVVKFHTDLMEEGKLYATLGRQTNAELDVVTEINVIDWTGKVVKVINACEQHLCHRFGICPTRTPGACDVIPEKSNNVYHIDISSIKKLGGLGKN